MLKAAAASKVWGLNFPTFGTNQTFWFVGDCGGVVAQRAVPAGKN